MDERWAQYWVNRYRWALAGRGDIDEGDLLQAAMIGMWEAEKAYKPELGSFPTYSAFWIRREIRLALGMKNGEFPLSEVHLDEPLAADSEETRLDMLADDALPDIDERLLQEERRQTIRDAVDRLQNPQWRDCVKKLYFDGKTAKQVAEEMNYPTTRRVKTNWENARRWLRRDETLKALRSLRHNYHIRVGVARFNTTHTSAVEESVLRFEHERGRLKSFLRSKLPE